MPLEQTITIVNNSGKIISTGKQLVSIFKEAKASYQDKKAQIKSDRAIKRAQTFDESRSVYYRREYDDYDDRIDEYDEDYDYEYGHEPLHGPGHDHGRRRSYDGYSEASTRLSRRSKSTYTSKSHHHHHRERGTRSRGGALTERNLQTLSEVSSTAPSKAPMTYHSPYAETLPRDMAVSKMDLAQSEMRSIAATERRRGTMSMHRRRSEPDMAPTKPAKEIDMHLAYGNIPPDLESRVDLDPAYQAQQKEHKAKTLVRKIEGLLDEAHCVQHSATHIISHLQQNPEAAAAVALSLAELSTLVGKLSPAFIGFIKGGSPAVFGLLASPQFLIGTGIAVGVTIVMFGGWKIVKKVKEAHAAREALAYDQVPMDRPAPLRTQSEFSAGIDEALVLEEELSTIETWRRGIAPMGDAESVEMELITPGADRANRERHGDADFDDLKSRRSTRTHRTSKTAKTAKTAKTHKSSRREERDVPERKSSRNATSESVAGTERSRRTNKGKEKAKPKMKALEDGRSRRGQDDEIEMAFRPKQRQGSNMLKALFKNKKNRAGETSTELVTV